MRQLLLGIAFVACLLAGGKASAQPVITLEGAWDFTTDEQGFRGDSTDYVMLPGSMLTNGKGDRVSLKTPWTGSLYDSSFYFNPAMEPYRREGQMKFPFFLTPERHYVGKAWYRRKVYVPREWDTQRVTLFLERPHIETTVYVNGQLAGCQKSLSTPHVYDVTRQIRFGASNEITICVDNNIENVCVGQDSHSVTDQTQGNWNGIVGRMELQAQWAQLNIRHVSVRGDAAKGTVSVKVELENHVDDLQFLVGDYFVKIFVMPLDGSAPPIEHISEAVGSKMEFLVILNEKAKLWDEFHPNLYLLRVEAGGDVYETTFGLRDVTIRGRQFYINGRPLFLRGTVENCCFPETGYPPMEEEEWMRIFSQCKRYGLNHVRFHSYCPPEAAFAAADRVGIYLQPEGPSWPNHGVKLRRGMAIDQYLFEESRRIVDEYGHHPSFLMMAAGNEPAGDWVSYCNDWVRQMHKYDSTKVYAGASVGGGWAWDNGSEYHVKGGARGLDWDRHAPSSDDDYYSGIEFPRNYKSTVPNNSPIIAHEQGQWCAFPDFSEIPQYTGAYKPGNFEIFRDLLAKNGMAQQAEKFLMASGRLQTLCYKYEIERNLRTKDYAGFQLLGLNDYSGQGTALVGALNVHWREKPYTTASQWRQSCNMLVPLARFPRFVYTTADTLVVPVEVYNAFDTAICGIMPTYTISSDSLRIVGGQRLSAVDTIPIGKNIPLGTVRLPLSSINAPAKLTLTVGMAGVVSNQWDFWVYPSNYASKLDSLELAATRDVPMTTNRKNPFINSKIIIADTLDTATMKALQRGANVLLTAAGRVTLGSDVRQTYLPVFWNTSWFKMRPPHTTGAYIDKSHPLFRHGFPTDDWANLNWWELLNRAQVMNLMELPADYQPPIQPIDTWHVSRKLGMLVEARVGKGRLLMTTMDICHGLEHRPVARQMRIAILSYMQSPDFQPTMELTPDVINHFFTRQAPPVDMFTNDSPDELKPKLTP
ncbi:MAG: beta-glucuronidase [Prevotella sp.]|nr:beta-glucuronidase [Prevotella sp.]